MTTTPDFTEFATKGQTAVQELATKGQTAAKEIAEAHAEAARAFAALPVPFVVPTPGTAPAPEAVVDGIFDYAHKALGIQRNLAKRLVAVAA